MYTSLHYIEQRDNVVSMQSLLSITLQKLVCIFSSFNYRIYQCADVLIYNLSSIKCFARAFSASIVYQSPL